MHPVGIGTFDVCVYLPDYADGFLLFDFLFQPFKFLRAEKFSERDAKPSHRHLIVTEQE